MFISFINDLITALEQHGVTVKLFADDLKLYLGVTNVCDLSKLQTALHALEDWERLWQLSVSPSKWCVLSVGKKVQHDSFPKLSICGSTVVYCHTSSKFLCGSWYHYIRSDQI